MSATQISTSVTIISSLLGFQAISLSNMDTSAATVITAGSKCEIKSAFFNFPTDLTPNASSWTAITTANTAYLTLTPSGTAGTQIVSASWSVTAPVWSDSAQGWYASAGSSIRYIGGCYKGGSTSYQDKFILFNFADTRQIRLLGNSDADRQIIFASDASISWDESSNIYKVNKPFLSETTAYRSDAATEDAVFDALDKFVPITGSSILVSGIFGHEVDTTRVMGFNATFANRFSTTEIRIYGGLWQVDADGVIALWDTIDSYMRCVNGAGTAPTSAGGAVAITFETASIAWG